MNWWLSLNLGHWSLWLGSTLYLSSLVNDWSGTLGISWLSCGWLLACWSWLLCWLLGSWSWFFWWLWSNWGGLWSNWSWLRSSLGWSLLNLLSWLSWSWDWFLFNWLRLDCCWLCWGWGSSWLSFLFLLSSWLNFLLGLFLNFWFLLLLFTSSLFGEIL